MRAVQAPADNTKTKYWPLPVATPMGMPGIPTADDQGHRQWGRQSTSLPEGAKTCSNTKALINAKSTNCGSFGQW